MTVTFHDLLTLIKLLKAEGVKAYRSNELSLEFHPEVSAGSRDGSEVGGRHAPQEAGLSSFKGSATDPPPAEAVEHPALRKLNANYARLTATVRNS
jgi:hypothetical protein